MNKQEIENIIIQIGEYNKFYPYKVSLLRNIFSHLKDLGTKKSKPKGNSTGICYSLYKFDMPGGNNLISILSKSWPKYSGRLAYPVPSTLKGHDECSIFHHYAENNRQWGRSKYANLRRELCIHLSKEIDKKIKEAIKVAKIKAKEI